MAEPTAADATYLQENPDMAEAFDRKFGAGVSAGILAQAQEAAPAAPPSATPEAPTPAPPEAAPQDDGVDGFIDNALDIASGIPSGILESVDNGGKLLEDMLDSVGVPTGVRLTNSQGEFDPGFMSRDDYNASVDSGEMQPLLGDRNKPENGGLLNAVDEPDTAVGKLTQGVSQFAVGLLGAGKILKGAGMLKLAAKGAVVDFSLFDPHEKRLSDIADEWGYGNIVTDALKSEPGDNAWIGRLKNAGEGVILGGVLDSFIASIKVLKGAKHKDVAAVEAALKEADDAAGKAYDADGNVIPQEAPVAPAAVADEAAPVAPTTVADEAAPVVKPVERDIIDTSRPPTPEELADKAYKTDGVDMGGEVFNEATAAEVDAIAKEIARTGALPKDIAGRMNLARHVKNAVDQRDLSAINAALSTVFKKSLSGVSKTKSLASMKSTAVSIVRRLDFSADPELAVQAALQRAGGVEQLQSELMAAELMTVSLETSANKLSQDITAGIFDAFGGSKAAAEAEYVRMIKMAAEANTVTQTILSGAGRTLRASQEGGAVSQAFGGVKTAIAQADHMARSKLGDSIEGVRDAAEKATGKQPKVSHKQIDPTMTAEEILHIREAAELEPSVFTKVASRVYLGAADGVPAVVEYTLNALLSGVHTHVANVAGTFYRMNMDPIEHYISGVPLLNWSRRGNKVARQEALDTFLGTYKASLHASKMAFHVLLKGENILDPLQKINESDVVTSIGNRNFDASDMMNIFDNDLTAGEMFTQTIRNGKNGLIKAASNMKDEGATAAAKNVLGNTVRAPSRLLAAEDEFFKVAAYHGKVGALARKQAIEEITAKQASAIADGRAFNFDKELAASIDQKMKDAIRARELSATEKASMSPDDLLALQNGKANDAAGLAYAEDITFTSRLEYGIGKHLQAYAQEAPAFKFILPFIRTPTNIFRYTLHRTPLLGMIQKDMRDAIRQGGVARQRAFAKQTVGIAFWATAGAMVATGKITGGYPKNKADRQLWKEAGIQPYSFVTEDDDGIKTYTSFQRAEPGSTSFGMVADLFKILEKQDEHNAGELSVAMVAALVANMTSKTYLKGLQDTIRFLQDMDGYGENFMANRFGMLVPSILSHFNDDPYLREAHGIAEAMLAKTSFSKRLDPQRNVLGQPILKPTEAYGPDDISPFAITTWKSDVVRDELIRLEASIGFPATSKGNIDLLSEDLRVSDTQSAYDRWLELTGTIDVGGMTLHQALEDLIDHPDWDTLESDDFDNGEFAAPGTKVGQVRALIREYQQIALEDLRDEHPKLDEMLMNDEDAKDDYKYSGRVPEALQQ